MDALYQSLAVVLISEMGDKTQLLALMLVLRYRAPFTILAGIFFATVLNHALASLIGSWLAQLLPEALLRYALAFAFLAFAVWALFPDKLEEEHNQKPTRLNQVFLATTGLFFMAEMGDKTQLATVALAAKFQSPWAVVIGTTLGMMVADGLAVFLGERLTKILPIKFIRIAASILFIIFAFGILYGLG